uniref:Crystaline entomocidal protoxin n=1 Tax=Bacillus thuringiensis TaxID=1428 RepID=V9HZX3_BACTU|nr:Cry8-like protein [Bacillus thuringiensis]
MSPNNQNEYEIIDATPSTSVSNDSTKYPYANEPTNALQNMNYKDYLRMSEGYDSEYAGSPEAFTNGQDAVKAAIGVVGQILGKLGVPFVGPIVSLYSALIDVLWPGGKSQWEIFMEQVEALINKKIAEYARNKAIAELEGLGNNYKIYLTALEEWQKNPSSTRVLRDVQNRFEILDSLFTQYMPSFRVAGYEVPLLTVYAQAANLHLLLLKDASNFGEEWGLTGSEVNTYYDRQMSLTAEYSDHCVKWYNTGLDQLKGSNAKQWVAYNRFRREMTLTVLDVVALFSSYDTRTYPIETTAQLTREVYMDPLGAVDVSNIGSWYDKAPSFSVIESAAIRPPHLFDFITGLIVYTQLRNLTSDRYIRFWAGHTIGYKKVNTPETNVQMYGTNQNLQDTSTFDFKGYNIYRTLSKDAVLFDISQSGYTYTFFGMPEVEFFLVNQVNNTSKLVYKPVSKDIIQKTRDSELELPPATSDPIISNAYSHRLNHITFIYSSSTNTYVPVFSWAHWSADLENTIYPEKITQIPAVKANYTGPSTTVINSRGLYGGNIVHTSNANATEAILGINCRFNFTSNQKYIVRIRYAADRSGTLKLSAGTSSRTIDFNATMTPGTSLEYNSFKYAMSNTFFEVSTNQILNLLIFVSENFPGNLYIDKFEFIPVDETYEAEQDLENAKKAVNALFTNTKDGLRPGVTDYEVNQAANLVECLSDDLYPNEKRLLFDAVREAKRLSEARNLLQDPDFQEINGENGWTASTGIEVVEGDALFKGRYLRLPGARQIDTETYPTYLYQKIDEGVLKPYTRYRLRGFVGRSQGLEIYTIRHQTNRIVKNVPDNLLPDASPGNAGDGINRCSEQKYVNSRLEGEKGLPNGSRSAEAHEFSLPIDIGEIDYNENAGVWVGFKITDPEGYATLGNLELVEEGPLSGGALERLQREEQQWKIQMTKRREETDRKYMIAKQAVDRLYADYQDQQLNPNVEITDITAAQNVIQSIPYVYNDAFPGLPGMDYTKFTELTDRLQQAWSLYDQRNAIPNGDFRNELSNWNTTAGVNVQQLNGTSVLVIPNWDAQVSQQFTVQPNQRYVLRVTARKEGVGNGYVSIRDGGNQTETLTFSASDYDTNGVYNIQASNTNGYNTSGVYNDQTGYITKTAEFIPHTNQVWIEMSETEGTFYIESVELIVDVE